jgi:four helix bundle protein
MSEKVIQEKSYRFALRIVRLYKHLCDERREFVLSPQTLTAGTLIGARVKAAQEAGSKIIFIQEMSVALQRASETEYWFQLLHEGGFIDDEAFVSVIADCVEVKERLITIVKSARKGQ